jgi:hypothetical protein
MKSAAFIHFSSFFSSLFVAHCPVTKDTEQAQLWLDEEAAAARQS